MVMMALEFAFREKLLCKEVSPLLSTRDIRELLTIKLATKKKTIADVLGQIYKRHRKRKEAADNFHQNNLLI